MSLHFPNSWLEILIVAGDAERLRLNREALRRERGKVHVARNGAEAGALLRGEGDLDEPIRPNAVVLDLSLPEPEWSAIAGAIVEAGLTGPVIAVDWQGEEEASAEDDGNAAETGRAPGGDLSRLIRQAIIQKRTEDERAPRVRNEQSSRPGAPEGATRSGSGGADDPGCHAGIRPGWLYLTLRESTEAGIMEGLAALRELAAGLPRRPDGPPPIAPAGMDDVFPNELIDRVVQRYRSVADVRGLRLLEIDDEYAPRIAVDDARLVAALDLLTAYTLHFGHPGLAIRISADAGDGDAVTFGVSLDGAGIPEDQLPLLADVFAAVAPIVEAHGARLWFGSSWGKSCGFHFRLPASPSDRHRPGASPSLDRSR